MLLDRTKKGIKHFVSIIFLFHKINNDFGFAPYFDGGWWAGVEHLFALEYAHKWIILASMLLMDFYVYWILISWNTQDVGIEKLHPTQYLTEFRAVQMRMKSKFSFFFFPPQSTDRTTNGKVSSESCPSTFGSKFFFFRFFFFCSRF